MSDQRQRFLITDSQRKEVAAALRDIAQHGSRRDRASAERLLTQFEQQAQQTAQDGPQSDSGGLGDFQAV